MPNRTTPLAERFFAKVNVTETCWLWTASVNTAGYGHIRDGATLRQAHRLSYEMARGPIPEGLVIDHLCRVPRCVNPAHLEAVSNLENIARGEGPSASAIRTGACQRGHHLTAENTWTDRHGRRTCKPCHYWNRERRLRSLAANTTS